MLSSIVFVLVFTLPIFIGWFGCGWLIMDGLLP